MSPSAILAIYCLLIVVASIAGGLIPMAIRLTHRRMELIVSFVAGVMLGVALLHLLGHAISDAAANPDSTATVENVLLMTLLGILSMFFIERFFCYHHHDVPELDVALDPPSSGGTCEDHSHAGHDSSPHSHDITWSGAAFGLSLHSVIAGVALAAAVAHDHATHVDSWAGFSTFLVIVLHKPFDSLTLGTLMARGNWPRGARHVVNGIFALAIPLGAVVFLQGFRLDPTAPSPALSYLLGFSAGTFLCIALSDILPELQFHHHDRVKLSLALISGLIVAYAVGLVGGGHMH